MKVADYLRGQYTKPGPGVNTPTPKTGMERFKFLVKNHFFRLMGINALFALFCVPVFTIPAAFSGMTKILMNLTRNGESFIWQDFWTEFKSDFPARMFIWFGLQLIPLACWYIATLLGSETIGIWISSFLGAIIFILECYWFPLITTLQISSFKCLKNSVLLLFLEWKRSLLLLLIGIGGFFVWMLLFPYSLPILLLISFSFSQLAVCVIVNEPMQKRIINPYTEAAADK